MPELQRGIKPVFTEAQTKAIRLAIKCYLEWEDNEQATIRSMTNALRQLDVAHREHNRRKKGARA